MVKVQQRGLGKGLSALMGDAPPAPSSPVEARTNAAPTSISIDKLAPGTYQPRTRFAEQHLRELADSIEKNGIVQPIVVRTSAEYPGRFEIVAGERRWRAARMAGLTNVPIVVKTISDQQALEIAIIENVQRQDLSPLEEAAGYKRLLDEFSHTQEALAKIVGKSRSHITNLLRLLALPESIKQMLDSNQLSMGHARAILTADNPVELADAIVAKGLNVRQAENLARSSNAPAQEKKEKKATKTTRFKSTDSGAKEQDIIALEETLTETLGLPVVIENHGEEGEIIIRYTSFEELDGLLSALSSGTV